MIAEDYCSYEVSKLLRDKGFNEPCTELNKLCLRDGEKPVLKVTHQKAMKWLRLKHNILLFLLPTQENGKLVYLVEVWTWNKKEGIYESTYAPMPRIEPEQAVEDALRFSLENLI